MTALFRFVAAFLLVLCTAHGDEEKWVDLFNGKDLSNWVNVNCGPETWKVEDGVIKCTGKPTGALRTPKMYENFIMEVEWRHMTSGGNAGVFIWGSPIAAKGVPFLRAIEVQVLDHGYGNTATYTTHGDVFPIHGSTMVPLGRHNGMRSFPSENRSKPSPEWNHYRIEGRDGILRLSVNGKEVSGGDKCNYRKGYLGLESEGAPTEWRMVRVQELPGSTAPAAETADEAKGHRQLYNGLDLRGWKTETPEAWQASDWVLAGKGSPRRPDAERDFKAAELKLGDKSSPAAEPLWTEAAYGNFELIFDVKVSEKAGSAPALRLRDAGGKQVSLSLAGLLAQTVPPPEGVDAGKWNRFIATVTGRTAEITVNGKKFSTTELPAEFGAKRAIGLEPVTGGIEFGNLYLRDL